MKLRKFLVVVLLLLWLLPAGVFSFTEEKPKVYAALETLAALAQEENRWQELKEKNPTRLDLAIFYNYCVGKLERQSVIMPEEEIDLLYREFSPELLLLNLKNRLDRQDEQLALLSWVDWQVGLSFLAEELTGDIPAGPNTAVYGYPPREPAVSLSQQLRLGLKVGGENTFARLILRNFGFWGIGAYSSGSLGINFTTADPPVVEEAYFQTRTKNFFGTLGRRYWRIDRFGLLGDFSYQPLEMVLLGWEKSFLGFAAIAASRVDTFDYYALQVSARMKDRLSFGFSGYTTAFRPWTRENYNLVDSRAAAGDFALAYWQKNTLAGEYCRYFDIEKENALDGEDSWLLSLDIFRDENLWLSGQYATIGNISLEEPAINQMSLEFIARDFLRYEGNSRGPQLFLWFKILPGFSGEYELAYRIKNYGSPEESINRSHILRLEYRIKPERFGYYFPEGQRFLSENKFASKIILEDRLALGDDSYNTVRLLASFSW